MFYLEQIENKTQKEKKKKNLLSLNKSKIFPFPFHKKALLKVSYKHVSHKKKKTKKRIINFLIF